MGFDCMNISFLKIRFLKASKVILVLFLVGLALDLWSTFRAGELAKDLEANPVFLVTGWGGLLFMNVLIIYLILKMYSKANPQMRFMACAMIMWLTVARIYVAYNNYKIAGWVEAGEITEAMAQAIPMEAKVSYYFLLNAVLLLAPVLFTHLTYVLFALDHKVVER